MKALKGALAVIALLAITSCGDRDPTFSLLQETDVFYQSSSSFNNKLDILWVIDNSGSMANLQSNIASNFDIFIQDFATKGYDYQIAVTTTDAWLAERYSDDRLSEFRNGVRNSTLDTNSGYRIITPSTPDPVAAFQINITQGVEGYGDERAFQSLRAALSNPLNAGFPRDDGFLAVIIVSDEDDFSKNSYSYTGEDYSDPDLHPVSDYVSFLDGLTSSTGATRRYSVSSVSILDNACLNDNDPWGNIADRYHALVAATSGVNGDVCSSNFAATLDEIQQKIAELSTQFFLSREPVVSTIVVKVDGKTIPRDSVNGWSYNSTANSIVFHGTAIPSQGAKISIDFDPVTVVQ